MSASNQEPRALGSAIHVRELVFLLALSTPFSGVIGCSKPRPKNYSKLITVFDERPFQMFCAGRPRPPQTGLHGYAEWSIGGNRQAAYQRTRLDTLDLPQKDVPALTVAAELNNIVQIAGANQDDWKVQFCAQGEGNTVDEADSNLQKVSVQRSGSLLTLGRNGVNNGGTLLLTGPAGAPLTVHSDVAVEIHDMDGPVRVSALGRATILNTTGRVEALAMAIDFAGSQGSVFLNSWQDIDFKITATRFRGSLGANAQHDVHAYLPPGFQTSVAVLVDDPKDFICRADFCSKIKKSREGGLYQFTYNGAQGTSDRIGMRSMDAQVVLETIP